jgi:acetyltransferase-like isoleucine patch superfamily enzyme
MGIIENFIRNSKGDNNYRIDPELRFLDLIRIVLDRLVAILRGTLIRLKLRKSEGLIYASKNVEVIHGRHIITGGNLTLHRGVYLNGLSKYGIKFGRNVTIQRHSEIRCTGVIKNIGEGITIGNDVGINSNCFIGGHGSICIGDFTIIGHGVKIYSENHVYKDPLQKIKFQGEVRQEVVIGEDCWIGANSIVLPGVKLGNGSVVAAGSVVTKSFPENSVLAGVPAKLIKTRV